MCWALIALRSRNTLRVVRLVIAYACQLASVLRLRNAIIWFAERVGHRNQCWDFSFETTI